MLRELFFEAERNANPFSIIFFDEIDSIAVNRDSADSNIDIRFVSALLTLMDGFNERKNVVVIASTNKPEHIDAAMRRGGRFEKEIEFTYLDQAGRADIFEVLLKNTAHNLDIATLASVTNNFSGADIKSLINSTMMCCLRRCFTFDKASNEIEKIANCPDYLLLTMQDFKSAFVPK